MEILTAVEPAIHQKIRKRKRSKKVAKHEPGIASIHDNESMLTRLQSQHIDVRTELMKNNSVDLRQSASVNQRRRIVGGVENQLLTNVVRAETAERVTYSG